MRPKPKHAKTSYEAIKIGINRQGIKKALGADIKKAVLIAKLPDLIKQSEYQQTETADKKDLNIKAFHGFSVDVVFEGKLTKVRLLIREYNNGYFHYNHHVIDPKWRGSSERIVVSARKDLQSGLAVGAPVNND